MISDTVSMSTRDLELLLQVSVPVPWTPKCQSPAQDVPDLVALFPQIALLLSPAISDEAVLKNNFWEFRQAPSARQNTSRLPLHVDVSVLFADEAVFLRASPSLRFRGLVCGLWCKRGVVYSGEAICLRWFCVHHWLCPNSLDHHLHANGHLPSLRYFLLFCVAFLFIKPNDEACRCTFCSTCPYRRCFKKYSHSGSVTTHLICERSDNREFLEYHSARLTVLSVVSNCALRVVVDVPRSPLSTKNPWHIDNRLDCI